MPCEMKPFPKWEKPDSDWTKSLRLAKAIYKEIMDNADKGGFAGILSRIAYHDALMQYEDIHIRIAPHAITK